MPRDHFQITMKLNLISIFSYCHTSRWFHGWDASLFWQRFHFFYFPTNFTFFRGYVAFAIVQLVSGKRENRSGILARDRSISDT